MVWAGRFLAAVRFLTVFPWPSSRDFPGDHLRLCLVFFPAVGLVLGLLGGGAAFFLWTLLPGPVAAVVITLVLLSFSGALHLDGLADTADGFFSSRPREGILAIMRDSRTGPMGVIALVMLLLLKTTSLAGLDRDTAWRAVLLMPLTGRSAIVLMMALLPYARPEGGLATLFYTGRPGRAALAGGALSMVIAPAVAGTGGTGAILLAAGAVLLFSLFCSRKIGGATGDTLGAGCEIAETAAALSFCLTAC